MESRLGEKRLGGVLGILLGRVYNMRHNADTQRHSPSGSRSIRNSVDKTATQSVHTSSVVAPAQSSGIHPETPNTAQQANAQGNPPEVDRVLSEAHPSASEVDGFKENTATPSADVDGQENVSQPEPSQRPEVSSSSGHWGKPIPLRSSRRHGPYLNGKLKLDTLELERVPLSVQILQKGFDWTTLTKLTLLHCQDHEHLWKMLRRNYSPTSPYNSSQQAKAAGKIRLEYGLNLKTIHTNAVSPSLIAFLKETLAPNSLEVLFLQEARSYNSSVTIEQIYKGPIRRHRASLKKMMIDSSEKGDDSFGSTRWRRWMLTTEIITYLTSGRMWALRELGVALDYRDWVRDLLLIRNCVYSWFASITSSKDYPTLLLLDPSTYPTSPTIPTAPTSTLETSHSRLSTS